jgi:Flp pilus assembly pilin Flp
MMEQHPTIDSIIDSIIRIWNDEEGQDLVEYALMLAFVALASVGLFSASGGGTSQIWSKINSELSTANGGS